MEELLIFDTVHLLLPAICGLIPAILLLIVCRKKNGVRPKYAAPFRVIAIILIIFAVITVVIIPVIGYGYLIIKFGFGIIFSGLKS